MLLARLLRMDEIVEVRVPTVEQEAARDLVRAREDVRGDLMRARHRFSKLLLRQGIVYYGGNAWTGPPEAGCAGNASRWPARQLAFDAAYEAVLATVARRDRLDAAITAMAANSEFTPVVRRLCCLRGISTLTGFGLAVEIGDWHRFTGATIGAYLGLVPTESSSGASRSQGSITKTGNSHARRLLVEAAWHHRKPYRPGAAMRARWEQAPPAARARGHAGNQRLHHRWAAVHRPQEAAGDRQRRRRPRAGRLVLVAGRAARLGLAPAPEGRPSPGMACRCRSASTSFMPLRCACSTLTPPTQLGRGSPGSSNDLSSPSGGDPPTPTAER